MTNIKNTKRALLSSVVALLLCFTMLLGSTFAWFTDSVTSAGNIIQTGELKVGFQWADGKTDPTTATWADVDGAIFDYANWEPGYAVARHLKVSNEGTLALNYQMRIVADGVVSKLADVIDVYYFAEDKALVRDDIADATYLGTLTEVLGTEKNFSKTVYGALKVGDPADIHTIVFKMKENAGDEYQAMDLGCTFSIQLIATQMASESDSFDNKYDDVSNVPNPSIPAALVRPLEDLDISYTLGIGGEAANATLDTGFKFEPTMSLDEALLSEYQLWHADFVVYTDVDVPANSMMLAGYYDAWCQYNNDNWVGLTADVDVEANTEIRLVELLGATVNWEDLCRYGNDGLGFQCGATDLTGENVGTTLTVELRLYKVGAQGECANGGGCKHPSINCEISADDYITVGKFTYTFGHKAAYVAEQLAAGANITLLNDIEFDKNTTISIPNGVESTLDLNGHTISVAADKTGNQELFNVKGNLTVKNGSIEMTAENNQGWGAMAAIFDVTAGGELTLDKVNATVSGTDMNFIVHLNNWGDATAIITDCDFNLSYVAVRAFNSGNDMNTVTIKNTDVTGGARLFWVHNYTAEGKGDSTLTLDIYGNNNTSEHAKPVRFGFDGEVYFDLNGNEIK